MAAVIALEIIVALLLCACAVLLGFQIRHVLRARDSVEAVGDNLRRIERELLEEVARVRSDVTGSVRGIEESVRSDVGRLSDSVREEVKGFSTALEGVQGSLVGEMDRVGETIREDVRGLGRSLGERVDRVERGVREEIAQTREDQAAFNEQLLDQLRASMQGSSESMTRALDDIAGALRVFHETQNRKRRAASLVGGSAVVGAAALVILVVLAVVSLVGGWGKGDGAAGADAVREAGAAPVRGEDPPLRMVAAMPEEPVGRLARGGEGHEAPGANARARAESTDVRPTSPVETRDVSGRREIEPAPVSEPPVAKGLEISIPVVAPPAGADAGPSGRDQAAVGEVEPPKSAPQGTESRTPEAPAFVADPGASHSAALPREERAPAPVSEPAEVSPMRAPEESAPKRGEADRAEGTSAGRGSIEYVEGAPALVVASSSDAGGIVIDGTPIQGQVSSSTPAAKRIGPTDEPAGEALLADMGPDENDQATRVPTPEPVTDGPRAPSRANVEEGERRGETPAADQAAMATWAWGGFAGTGEDDEPWSIEECASQLDVLGRLTRGEVSDSVEERLVRTAESRICAEVVRSLEAQLGRIQRELVVERSKLGGSIFDQEAVTARVASLVGQLGEIETMMQGFLDGVPSKATARWTGELYDVQRKHGQVASLAATVVRETEVADASGGG